MAAPSPAYKEFLGDELLRKTADGKVETVPTLEALSGKKGLLFYFSAHWCPPCKAFTPKLAEWYKQTLQKDGIEVIFLSSDRDESSFTDYYNEMPWLAVPYAARDVKEKASKRLGVRGIPMLVVLGMDGEIINLEGRAAVTENPSGFPWQAPKGNVIDMLKGPILTKDGVKSFDEIKADYIGVYSSAHWCPPCKNFTPKFAQTYKALKEAGKSFEVIFVSSDRDEASFNDYYKEMPWTALPFDEKSRNDQIGKHFEVEGIPNLVILDKDLKVVTDSAVGQVSGDPEGKNFPWTPKPVNDIDENPDGINENQTIIVLQAGLSKEQQDANYSVLVQLAEEQKAKTGDCGEPAKDNLFTEKVSALSFLTANEKSGSLANRVKSTAKITDDEMHVIVFDVPNGSHYKMEDCSKFSPESVRALVADIAAGKVEKKSL